MIDAQTAHHRVLPSLLPAPREIGRCEAKVLHNRARHAAWREANRERVRAKTRAYYERRSQDPAFKADRARRWREYYALKVQDPTWNARRKAANKRSVERCPEERRERNRARCRAYRLRKALERLIAQASQAGTTP